MVAMRYRGLLAAALILALLPGCKQATYTQEVKAFGSSVDTAAVSIGAIYSNLNDEEVSLYVEQLLVDPTQSVGLRAFCVNRKTNPPTVEAGDTVLGKPRFDPRAIAARVSLLGTLRSYGDALIALSTNTSPDDVKKSLSDLSTSFTKTAADIGNTKDPAIARYAGPLATIFGTGASIYLQRRRSAELDRIIKQAAPIVTDILTFIKTDSSAAQGIASTTLQAESAGWQQIYQRILYAELHGRAPMSLRAELPDCAGKSGPFQGAPPPPGSVSKPPAVRVVKLSANRDAAFFTLRQAVLAHIVDANKAQRSFDTAAPGKTIDSLSKAHRALVDFASKPDDQLTIANLKSAVDLFKADAETLYGALQDLRKPPQKGK